MTPKAKLAVSLAALGAASLLNHGAIAASPAYCALYAREYAIETVQPGAAAGMLQSVQDQAYYRCLNQDEDPPLPKTSAYAGAPVEKTATLEAIAKPADAARTADTAKTGVTIPAETAPAPKPRPTVVAQAGPTPGAKNGRNRGSGLTPWTQAWASWCQKHFPNSFDPKTGTILPYDTQKREFCD
jgi:hypothetical protein